MNTFIANKIIPFTLSTLALCCSAINASAASPSADFEVSAGAEQDSNLNVVELDKNSNESDIATLLNAKLDANWKPVEKLSLSGGYAYSTKLYQKNDSFNLALHQFSADANYDFDVITAGASYHYADALLDGENFLKLGQSSFYVSKLINDSIYLRAATNIQDKTFASLAERDARNTGFAGDAFVFFNSGKTFVSVGVMSEDENAKAKQFDYQGTSVRSKVSHKFSVGDTENKVQLGWRYSTRDYAGVTPEIKTERYDTSHVLDAEWEINFTSKVSLVTKVERGNYESNLKAADYDKTRSSLLLKVRF